MVLRRRRVHMQFQTLVRRSVIAIAGCVSAVAIVAQTNPPKPAITAPHGVSPNAVFEQYCVFCHNAKLKTAGLDLQGFDPTAVGAHPDVWEKAARKLRTREMPPPGLPRPDDATYLQAADRVEAALDTAAAAHPKPGSVPVHRLNRVDMPPPSTTCWDSQSTPKSCSRPTMKRRRVSTIWRAFSPSLPCSSRIIYPPPIPSAGSP